VTERKLSKQSKDQIIAIAKLINSHCDGAFSQDGCGFNKADSGWFKWWLGRDEIRSEQIIMQMYNKLKLYKRQLLNYGINYDSIELTYDEYKVPEIDPTWMQNKINFGTKYNGQTFADIIATEDGRRYLQFIADKFDDGRIKQAAIAVLSGQPITNAQNMIPEWVTKNKKGEYMHISLDGEYIIIRSSMNFKDEIKSLSSRQWNEPVAGAWSTKIQYLDEVVAKFPNASYDDALKVEIEKQHKLRSRANAMQATKQFELGHFGNGKQILPFQMAGLEFVELTDGKAMIADEMGTGKTIQAMSVLQLHPERRPAIIVCPASLKFNWRTELELWLTTNDKVQVINSGKAAPISASVVVINYEVLGKWMEEIKRINPKIAIFDESHLIKNVGTGRTKAASELAKQVPYRIELTGTPVLNRPLELYSQLTILDPVKYPPKAQDPQAYYRFAYAYCDPKQVEFTKRDGTTETHWTFNGASNLDQLNNELKGLMIRRTKEQVLPELPDKRRSAIPMALSNVREFNTQLQDFKKWLLLNRDRHDASLEALPKLEYLKQMCVEGKMKSSIDWLENSFIANGQKVVVFTMHQSTIDTLIEKFKDVSVSICGATSQKDREKAVIEFQNNPNILMFIGNIKAAGVGITLTAASSVVFLEFDWTPGIHDQAEDRCHRMGQKNAVNCYYVLADNSIDCVILEMLERKRHVVEQIVGDDKVLDFNLFTSVFDEIFK
jgi:SWI/SNF-related matrix-associated actin-dependent regulator 1 of chromatin subfamily A